MKTLTKLYVSMAFGLCVFTQNSRAMESLVKEKEETSLAARDLSLRECTLMTNDSYLVPITCEFAKNFGTLNGLIAEYDEAALETQKIPVPCSQKTLSRVIPLVKAYVWRPDERYLVKWYRIRDEKLEIAYNSFSLQDLVEIVNAMNYLEVSEEIYMIVLNKLAQKIDAVKFESPLLDVCKAVDSLAVEVQYALNEIFLLKFGNIRPFVKVIQRFVSHDEIKNAAFNKTGRFMLLSHNPGPILQTKKKAFLYDLASKPARLMKEFDEEENGTLSTHVFSPDGSLLAWPNEKDKSLCLIELETGNERQLPYFGRTFSFSDDSKVLSLGKMDSQACFLYDVTSGLKIGDKEAPVCKVFDESPIKQALYEGNLEKDSVEAVYKQLPDDLVHSRHYISAGVSGHYIRIFEYDGQRRFRVFDISKPLAIKEVLSRNGVHGLSVPDRQTTYMLEDGRTTRLQFPSLKWAIRTQELGDYTDFRKKDAHLIIRRPGVVLMSLYVESLNDFFSIEIPHSYLPKKRWWCCDTSDKEHVATHGAISDTEFAVELVHIPVSMLRESPTSDILVMLNALKFPEYMRYYFDSLNKDLRALYFNHLVPGQKDL